MSYLAISDVTVYPRRGFCQTERDFKHTCPDVITDWGSGEPLFREARQCQGRPAGQRCPVHAWLTAGCRGSSGPGAPTAGLVQRRCPWAWSPWRATRWLSTNLTPGPTPSFLRSPDVPDLPRPDGKFSSKTDGMTPRPLAVLHGAKRSKSQQTAVTQKTSLTSQLSTKAERTPPLKQDAGDGAEGHRLEIVPENPRGLGVTSQLLTWMEGGQGPA